MTSRAVIAVAVIEDAAGQVLIARRPRHVHQGGLWELPGGKVEAGESVQQALRREIREEIGIELGPSRPLLRVSHEYADRHVLLDVWRCRQWRGQACGCEGQEIAWRTPSQLRAEDFPAADRPILRSLTLPPLYLISPEPKGCRDFLPRLRQVLAAGVRLVQFRSRHLQDPAVQSLLQGAMLLCRQHGARLMLNAPAAWPLCAGIHGRHLRSAELMALRQRPDGELLSASCHDEDELCQAARLGVDFVVLGPVCATASHPDTAVMGWDVFAERVDAARLPVYALGGMQPVDMSRSLACRAQGLAMISAVWSAADPAAVIGDCLKWADRAGGY